MVVEGMPVLERDSAHRSNRQTIPSETKSGL